MFQNLTFKNSNLFPGTPDNSILPTKATPFLKNIRKLLMQVTPLALFHNIMNTQSDIFIAHVPFRAEWTLNMKTMIIFLIELHNHNQSVLAHCCYLLHDSHKHFIKMTVNYLKVLNHLKVTSSLSRDYQTNPLFWHGTATLKFILCFLFPSSK